MHSIISAFHRKFHDILGFIAFWSMNNAFVTMWPLIRRDIIRDCQRVAALLSEDGCRENCRNMTSTDGIEYKCSCHERNVLCCAQDYYYHNINFSTMKLNEIYPLISAYGFIHKTSHSSLEVKAMRIWLRMKWSKSSVGYTGSICMPISIISLFSNHSK